MGARTVKRAPTFGREPSAAAPVSTVPHPGCVLVDFTHTGLFRLRAVTPNITVTPNIAATPNIAVTPITPVCDAHLH